MNPIIHFSIHVC